MLRGRFLARNRGIGCATIEAVRLSTDLVCPCPESAGSALSAYTCRSGSITIYCPSLPSPAARVSTAHARSLLLRSHCTSDRLLVSNRLCGLDGSHSRIALFYTEILSFYFRCPCLRSLPRSGKLGYRRGTL